MTKHSRRKRALQLFAVGYWPILGPQVLPMWPLWSCVTFAGTRADPASHMTDDGSQMGAIGTGTRTGTGTGTGALNTGRRVMNMGNLGMSRLMVPSPGPPCIVAVGVMVGQNRL